RGAGALLSSPFTAAARALDLPGTLLGNALGPLRGQMAAITETGRMAQRLGLAAETVAGIQLLAGGAADDVARSMFHTAHERGKAAGGAKEAADKFALLGLDARELARLPLDEALGKVADKVSLLPEGVQQATAAFEIFSKRGESMLPFLL